MFERQSPETNWHWPPQGYPCQKKTFSKSLCFFSMVSIPSDFIPEIVAVDGAEALVGLHFYKTFIHLGTFEEWLLCLFLCLRVPTTSYKCKPKLDVCVIGWITYFVFYISGFSRITKKYQNTTAPWVEWSQRHHSHRHHGPDLSRKTRKGHLEWQDYYRGLSTSQGKVKERYKL